MVWYYWDAFLRTYAGDIRGSALEIGNTTTVRAHGKAAVTRATALDVAPGKGVDVVADLQRAWNVDDGTYDVFVNQFSMHVIEDDLAALFHSVRVLRPGGVLLVNFPSLSSYPSKGLSYEEGGRRAFVQRWYTPAGVQRMLAQLGLAGHSTIETFGNDVGVMACVHGLPLEVLWRSSLTPADPAHPVLVCARIVRPPQWPSAWQPDDAPSRRAGSPG